jgi:general secretion pathway protein G
VIQHWFEKHREGQARRSEEGFDGFTLIELLIVIVVLGILAAVVIFALGGVTGQSKESSCNADAKSVEVAVEAYKASPNNATSAWPQTMTDLTAPTFQTSAFLRTAPGGGNGYTISLGGVAPNKKGVVLVSITGGGVPETNQNYDTNNVCVDLKS